MKNEIYVVVYENREWGCEETSLLGAFKDYENADSFAKEKLMELLKEEYINAYGEEDWEEEWEKATKEDNECFYADGDFRVYVSTLTLK